jgi:hypothetical protein
MADKELWQFYRVRLDFITQLCASVPGDPELVQKWIDSRKPRVRPPGGKTIDEINEEVFATLPQEEEPVSVLVFQRDPTNGRNLVIRASTLKSHMKDCASIISTHYVGKIEGERSFAVKVKNCVYHDETQYWIPVLRPDGSKIFEPDGQRDKPIHTRDARGRPINALKTFEFIYPARIDFRLKVLGGAVKQRDLETLFSYGGTHGYAGERSDGEGRYTFSIKQEAASDAKERNGNGESKDSTRTESSARVVV